MARYRLGPLREARDLDVRVTRGELAAAAADARATEGDAAGARARVASARAALDAAVRERVALVEAGARPALIALAERCIGRRRAELDAAIGAELRTRAALDGRLTAVEEARGRVAIARAGRAAIEQHFARWRDRMRRRAEHREE